MIRKVFLYGKAAKLFGKVFHLDVNTLAEAVRAIGSQIPGFRKYVTENDFRCVRGRNQKSGFVLDADQIELGLGKSDLHIVPVIAGSGGKMGVGKIIAGVLLAGAAFFVLPFAGAGATLFGLTKANLVVMAAGMVASGVSSVLSPQAKTKEEKSSDSYLFNGSVGMANQGSPVPLAYGHVFIQNPRVINASIVAEEIAV